MRVPGGHSEHTPRAGKKEVKLFKMKGTNLAPAMSTHQATLSTRRYEQNHYGYSVNNSRRFQLRLKCAIIKRHYAVFTY